MVIKPKPESFQLSTCFCLAVLRQIPHTWKLSCTWNMLQPEKFFFPPGSAAEGLWAVFSQICHSQHSVHVLTESPSVPGAVPGQGHLLCEVGRHFCPKSCLHSLCWVTGSIPFAERAKTPPRAFPSHVGWSLWAPHRTLSLEL